MDVNTVTLPQFSRSVSNLDEKGNYHLGGAWNAMMIGGARRRDNTIPLNHDDGIRITTRGRDIGLL